MPTLLQAKSRLTALFKREVPKDGTIPVLLARDNVSSTSVQDNGLAGLPYDVLRIIALLIGPLSTHKLAQVSLRLYSLLQDDSMWIEFAKRAVHDARVVVFDTVPDASALDIDSIKRALGRSKILNQAWGNHEPLPCRPLLRKEMRLYSGHPERVAYGRNSNLDRLIVMPYRTDFLDGTILFGPHGNGRGFGDYLFYPYHREGTHFVTLNKLHQSRIEDQKLSMRLTPLSLKNDKEQPERHVTHSLGVRVLPDGCHLVDQVIDSSNQRSYALFTRHGEPLSKRMLKVAVVLDWKSTASIIFNTGLQPDHERAVSSIHLSHDGSRIDVCADDARHWAHASFQLTDILESEDAIPLADALGNSSRDVDIAPIMTNFALFEPCSDPFMRHANPYPYLYYTFPQPRQTSIEEPALFSHVRLYKPGRDASFEFGSSLRLSQFYVDERGPAPRFLLTLQDLVQLQWGTLLLSVSFTHVAWIEEVSQNHGIWGLRRMQRTLKLAAFPAPGSARSSNSAELTPVQLDIPHSCLAKACNIYLEPTLASVFILCEGNKLHKFQFA